MLLKRAEINYGGASFGAAVFMCEGILKKSRDAAHSL
jgi:hypothetical protein